jgi:Protein of unknown function (DUF3891)
MLLREDERGCLAIGQASHAWISGQLARAWGNERFGRVEPFEEVCLAAEQHDVGMAEWDLEPSRNPQTGLPHSFMEMSIEQHLKLWRAAPRRLLTQSRYAALLVSMHGARLYGRRDVTKLPDHAAQDVRAYLAEQREFQEHLLATLQADRAAVARNSRLIWIWDLLSLALCLDWAPHTAKEVPTATEPVDVEITATESHTVLDPWPFAADGITVRCDGIRLTGTFGSDRDLQAALAHAPWESVTFEIRPETR